jgi:hypothetical protein
MHEGRPESVERRKIVTRDRDVQRKGIKKDGISKRVAVCRWSAVRLVVQSEHQVSLEEKRAGDWAGRQGNTGSEEKHKKNLHWERRWNGAGHALEMH